MLFRVAKRKTSAEMLDFDEFLETEWAHKGTWEIRASVFRIADNEAVRAFLEHCACAPLDLKLPNHGYDVDGIVDSESTDEPDLSAFLRPKHEELRFQNEDDLRSRVRRLFDERGQRTRAVPKDQARAYLATQSAKEDPWCRTVAKKNWTPFRDEY